MKFYCVGVLDGEGEDDRRTAKTIHHLKVALMNAVRMSGHKADDQFYGAENDYMPEHCRRHSIPNVVVQTWDDQRKILGF